MVFREDLWQYLDLERSLESEAPEVRRLVVEKRSRRILLVDDDSDIRECVSLALTEAGYEVLEARDGLEGMRRVERDRPELVILDLVMPHWSGMTVLDHLRQGQVSQCKPSRGEAPPVQVIMISGQDQTRFQALAETKGVDAYLAKPFSVDVLLAKVKKLLPLAPLSALACVN